MPQPTDNDLITFIEAAAILGLSGVGLRYWLRREGGLPVYNLWGEEVPPGRPTRPLYVDENEVRELAKRLGKEIENNE